MISFIFGCLCMFIVLAVLGLYLNKADTKTDANISSLVKLKGDLTVKGPDGIEK